MYDIKKLEIEIDLLQELIESCVVTTVDKENLFAVLHERELAKEKLKEFYQTESFSKESYFI